MILAKCLLFAALLGVTVYGLNSDSGSVPKKTFLEPGNIYDKILFGSKNSDGSMGPVRPIFRDADVSGEGAGGSMELPEGITLAKRIYINRQGFRPVKRSMAIGRAGMRPGKRSSAQESEDSKEQFLTGFEYFPFEHGSYFEVQ